jgi:hypothetical protein
MRIWLWLAGHYKSLDSILRRHLDQQPLNPPAARSLPSHDNIRGAAYFE